jgi:SAM-dependent methyltransferase
MKTDVPSPIDLRQMQDARVWADEAMRKRPVRREFFACFAQVLGELASGSRRVLELGSGPGFLASHLLESGAAHEIVALDFSPAMHELARERLGHLASKVHFVERSFLDPAWVDGLGLFDAVVTNQAVHELRHKSRTTNLHRQVKAVLAPHAKYLVCDHFVGEGGMSNSELYMTVDEQLEALRGAGFNDVTTRLVCGGLALHVAGCMS